jgi:hypothetical protein
MTIVAASGILQMLESNWVVLCFLKMGIVRLAVIRQRRFLESTDP